MLRQLRVKNFRNHIDNVIDFSPHTTLVVGKNGTGKTSLLEAIIIAYRGSSFRGSDSDVVRAGAQWYRIDAVDERARSVTFEIRRDKKIKQFTVDDKKTTRLPQKTKRAVVLFSPDDLQLLSGSPSRRRRYLDTILSSMDVHYSAAIHRYERSLLQRNRLLKDPRITQDELFSWNLMLAENGSYIITARHDLIEKIDQLVSKRYNTIARIDDLVSVSYTHHKVSSARLLSEYEASYEKDRILGTTSHGPHRHDLIVEMNSKLAQSVASRGENRTIILALKSIEADIIEEVVGQTPIILLDDVYGELDHTRQRLVSDAFGSRQTIITATHSIDDVGSSLVVMLD